MENDDDAADSNFELDMGVLEDNVANPKIIKAGTCLCGLIINRADVLYVCADL